MQKERRQFIRFKLLLKGEVELEAGTEFSSGMHTIDFSRAGVRIFIPKKNFTKPESLKLKVNLPDRNIPVKINGGVKWMHSQDNGWEIGAKIDDIDPADKCEILEYAYKLWKEKKK